MNQLCFATNNLNKLAEIRKAVGNRYEILSLQDIGCNEALPETHETLEENSLEKASYVYEKFKVPCFADDTGLEIDALNGAPGVYSARYAGESCSFEDNMSLVLKNLEGMNQRTAQFRTVITLIGLGETKQFEGVAKGEMTVARSGAEGFGYDPIFKPQGYDVTFSEMSMEEKNEISHRGLAVRKLIDFLGTTSA